MKNIILGITLLYVLGMSGLVNATLIQNGDFESGDLTGWMTRGDVQIGNTNDLFGEFAEFQGMSGSFAVLGLNHTDGRSQIRQDFDLTGVSEVHISFNWAFDYWDNSSSAQDGFLSLVRQDGAPASRITLRDLQTHGSGFFNPDLGLAHGFYEGVINLSSFTTEEARMIFRLTEEADDAFWTGTASVVGIDNVSISSTAAVPEPQTMLLFGTGLAGLAGLRLRRKK